MLNELEAKGAETVYTDNAGESAEVKELLYLTAEVQDAALPDAIIEKHKVQAEYDWMVRNFTVQEEVPELYHENSDASRLYAYMGQKKSGGVADRAAEKQSRRAFCNHHHV